MTLFTLVLLGHFQDLFYFCLKDKFMVSNLYSRKWQKKLSLKCYVVVQV